MHFDTGQCLNQGTGDLVAGLEAPWRADGEVYRCTGGEAGRWEPAGVCPED